MAVGVSERSLYVMYGVQSEYCPQPTALCALTRHLCRSVGRNIALVYLGVSILLCTPYLSQCKP